MGNEQALKLTLIGHDQSASKALHGVERSAKGVTTATSKLGTVGKGAMLGIAAGLVVAGKAAIDFGGDSIKAFADADKSQKQLEAAYKRFPKLANVNIDSLRKYNQALQRKTGADADDIASAQAQLGAYKLSGKQIKAMTPLLVDYATKTGKTLPAAAKDLGKAVMGQGKALKTLGVDFKDAKDPAKNYAQVMAGLKEKIGGYASEVPEAEKKSKILAASFGDLQEGIGEKLQPAMIGLTDAGQGVLDWLDANPEAAAGASAALDLLGQGFSFLWDVLRKYVAPALGWFIKQQGNAVRSMGSMVDAMNQVDFLNLIPDDAGDKMRTIADGIDTVGTGLESLANDPPMKVDTKPAVANVDKLNARIKGIKDRIVKAEARGDTKAVDKLKAKLDKLRGKKLDIQANVRKTGISNITIRGVGGGKMHISANASGTSSNPFDQLSVVGEGGPEIVRLPARAQVMSNGQSRAFANQGGLNRGAGSASGGMTVQMILQGLPAGPRAFAEAIERELYGLMRSRGPGGTLSFLRKR